MSFTIFFFHNWKTRSISKYFFRNYWMIRNVWTYFPVRIRYYLNKKKQKKKQKEKKTYRIRYGPCGLHNVRPKKSPTMVDHYVFISHVNNKFFIYQLEHDTNNILVKNNKFKYDQISN